VFEYDSYYTIPKEGFLAREFLARGLLFGNRSSATGGVHPMHRLPLATGGRVKTTSFDDLFDADRPSRRRYYSCEATQAMSSTILCYRQRGEHQRPSYFPRRQDSLAHRVGPGFRPTRPKRFQYVFPGECAGAMSHLDSCPAGWPCRPDLRGADSRRSTSRTFRRRYAHEARAADREDP
jgi:hypothetical protein